MYGIQRLYFKLFFFLTRHTKKSIKVLSIAFYNSTVNNFDIVIVLVMMIITIVYIFNSQILKRFFVFCFLMFGMF